MTDHHQRLFAGRGIGPRGILVVAAVVVGAFALGIGVGWGTSLVGDQLASPEPSPSATPSVTATPEPDVSVPPLTPIDRELDDADTAAGLLSLDVTERAEGTFSIVSGDGTPTGAAAAVKWVRVEYEEGLAMDGAALSDFVVDALNDYRGWGAHGAYEFVPTSGASDIRVVIASPYTTAARCPDPHAAAPIGAVADAASPTPTPSPSAAAATSCADEGLTVISEQDWAAGIAAYGDDRTGARDYLVNHGVGHLLGEEDAPCLDGRAQAMTDQTDLADGCEPNPWPWPDEPEPRPTPSATASAARDEE